MPPPKVKRIRVELKSGPHNGDGKPNLQFPDPVTGERIGGQVAAIRMAMRYPHTVCAWARRQGKTKFRQFLLQNEAMNTSGAYYAGIVYPDHTSAAKVAENFRESWGQMVKDSHINSQDQDRWIDLHPFEPLPAPPKWFTPRLVAKWKKCADGQPNTSVRIYFWGGAMPHARKIQGFPHPFHRVDFDECQEIEPPVYQIVRPMLRDVRGHECFSGTPWSGGIGNVQFEKFWDVSQDRTAKGWFGMRIPDGSNPHVPPTDLAEARRSMGDREIRQTMYAEFLSDAGAVFSNLDAVFVLTPLPPDAPETAWIAAMRARYTLPSMQWWVHAPKAVPGHVYGLSVDWARSPKGDYSVLTVMDFSTGEQAAVLRWRGEDFTAQMEVVLEVQKFYGAQQLHSDDNGLGRPMQDFLRRRHALGFVGHRFSAQSKPDYVRRLQVLFVDAGLSLIACPEQRNEFKSFSCFESDGIGSEKQLKYCAPEGEHDDFVAAVLQLAPTLTICGRQMQADPEPQAEPVIDVAGRTTLALFGEGRRPPPSREEGEEAGKDWRSVILPPSMR